MRLSSKILTAFCLAFLLPGCGDDNGSQSGSTAKDFRLDTLSHNRFYLNAHKGKVVVLLFWNTQCTICKRQMVDLKSLVNPSDSDNLTVAAVCTDPEHIDDVKKTAENLGIDYPILLDRGAEVAGSYKVSVYPTTIIIDKAGKISFTREGYDSAIARQIKTRVTDLLASETPGK